MFEVRLSYVTLRLDYLALVTVNKKKKYIIINERIYEKTNNNDTTQPYIILKLKQTQKLSKHK